MSNSFAINPQLDLVLEREVDVPPQLVWDAWTKPEHLVHWFCPKPWGVSACELDVRPGGIFRTTMRSPEGQEFPSEGCYLEVVPLQRLVWTSVLQGGYRPAASAGEFPFTGIITLEPTPTGTRYTATALHPDESSCDKHRNMGFHEGWGIALDQLVAYMKSLQ